MKMIIIGGFLGSGKTTLLSQFLRYLVGENPRENQVIVIENEIGEVSIDDKILSTQGYNVETMFSGCACCTIKGQVEIGVRDIIKNYQPEYIVFEASGVACPDAIRKNLLEVLDIDCTVCTLVDAQRWLILARGVASLLEDQLAGAEFILVNKVDKVDETTLQEIHESLKKFGAEGNIVDISASGTIDPDLFAQIAGRR